MPAARTGGSVVENFNARTVFFVSDAERSLAFYTGKLGFTLDWNHQEGGRAFVCQVSLFGFSLIQNQIEPRTEGSAGHGRVFLGLEDQIEALRQHIAERGLETTIISWGAPTLVIRDLDGNELLCWLPRIEWPELEAELAKQAG
jgi:catechol 2,3-dioxygenase-like lactoylglutathione lyase family enzyme